MGVFIHPKSLCRKILHSFPNKMNLNWYFRESSTLANASGQSGNKDGHKREAASNPVAMKRYLKEVDVHKKFIVGNREKSKHDKDAVADALTYMETDMKEHQNTFLSYLSQRSWTHRNPIPRKSMISASVVEFCNSF